MYFFKKLDFISLGNGFRAGQREFDREENKSFDKNLCNFISVVRTTRRNVSDNNSPTSKISQAGIERTILLSATRLALKKTPLFDFFFSTVFIFPIHWGTWIK